MSTSSKEPHSSRQGMQPKTESPLSLEKMTELTYVSHNDVDQNQFCSTIADCQYLTQAGNYSHGYIGAKGNKEET